MILGNLGPQPRRHADVIPGGRGTGKAKEKEKEAEIKTVVGAVAAKGGLDPPSMQLGLVHLDSKGLAWFQLPR